jgi:hypothetical protein
MFIEIIKIKILQKKWDSYMPCEAMAYSTKSDRSCQEQS